MLALAVSTTFPARSAPTGTSRRRAGRTERGPRRRRGTSPPPWEEATARSSRGIRSGSVRARITRPPRSAGTATRCGFVGREGHPIRVRAMPGARATIDGGLNLLPPATYVEIRDLEITVSEPRPAAAGAARPLVPERQPALGRAERLHRHRLQVHQPGHPRQQPGRELVVRHPRTASSTAASSTTTAGRAPTAATATPSTPRTTDGTKTIADCVMTGGHGYTLHAYGSSRGRRRQLPRRRQHRLRRRARSSSAAASPSRRIRVHDNILHGVAMQLGLRRRPRTRTARCATTSSSTRA